MKRVLIFIVIFCNNINAGSGASKPDSNKNNINNNTNNEQSDLNPEGDLKEELTEKERDLLIKVLSNEKVLNAVGDLALKKINTQFNGQNNSNINLNNGSNKNSNPISVPNFTINLNASHNLSNTSNNNASNNNTNEVHVTQIQQLYNLLKEYSKSAGSFLYRHRYKIIIIAIIIIVSILFYKLIILKYALTSTQCLTNCWQSGKTLADILSMPTSELTKDLIQTICTKFSGPEAFANCAVPLSKFMQQISSEKAAIIAYTKICATLAFLKISFLFPIDNEIVKTSQERLNKLSYMQKIIEEFMSKCCADKIASGNFA